MRFKNLPEMTLNLARVCAIIFCNLMGYAIISDIAFNFNGLEIFKSYFEIADASFIDNKMRWTSESPRVIMCELFKRVVARFAIFPNNRTV